MRHDGWRAIRLRAESEARASPRWHVRTRTMCRAGSCESDGQRRRVLSDRERDILAWAAEGKSSWEIATILGVSERTVNWHVEQSKKKLDAVTRTQAVIKALRSGEI